MVDEEDNSPIVQAASTGCERDNSDGLDFDALTRSSSRMFVTI